MALPWRRRVRPTRCDDSRPEEIVGTNGHPVPEAAQLLKDTVAIGLGERYDLEFVADNPGAWVYNCHILSHVQSKGVEPGGMIPVIKVAE